MALGVVVLLSLFAGQAVHSLRKKFTTFDEGYYLSGGYSYLRTGDTRMVNRFHPPLAQLLVALPLMGLELAAPERDPAWYAPKGDLSSRDFALNFLYRNRAPWQTILTRGRLMMVGLGVLTGVLAFLWATELWGLSGGFLALTLYAFSPNLLAHSRLTTTDFPVAALAFAACYLLWRFFRRPELLRLILAGLVLGLALLAKLSALIFCLIAVLLAALYVLVPGAGGRDRAGWRGRLDEVLRCSRASRAALAVGTLVVVFALACAVIWLGYLGARDASRADVRSRHTDVQSGGGTGVRVSAGSGLRARVYATGRRVIPWPREYWELLSWFLAKSQGGHRAFLAGRLSQTGWWYYFPFVLAVKTPLPTLLLVLAVLLKCGLSSSRVPFGKEGARPDKTGRATPGGAATAQKPIGTGWKRRRIYDGSFLLLPPVVFLLVSMTSHVNIGYRHVLPVLPFLLVFGSQVAAWPVRRTWHRWLPLGALLLWYVAGTVRVGPHYLAYFNELTGGPRQAYQYLVDSNLDWGQDLLGLADYVREQGIEEVKLAYFGMATPDIIRSLGIPHQPISRKEQREPSPGVFAVSATRLQGAYGTGLFGDKEKPFPWLRKLEPEALIGYTIFVYRVTEADVARLKEQAR